MQSPSFNRTAVRTAALLISAILVVAVGFGWFLVSQARTADFVQFLLDRRQGLGQTTPDRHSRCRYNLGTSGFVVTRTAHGQTITRTINVPGRVVEGFFGGQEALIETPTTAETFNCTNGEHLSHPITAARGDVGDPISRVLFATSGRTLAIVLKRHGREDAIETLNLKVDAGQSVWDQRLGPDATGLDGHVVAARLVGESLLVVIDVGHGQLALHTYNFRANLKNDPWNTASAKHAPRLVKGALVTEPSVVQRGKSMSVTVRSGRTRTNYSYDFTCKLPSATTVASASLQVQAVQPKPCTWSAE